MFVDSAGLLTCFCCGAFPVFAGPVAKECHNLFSDINGEMKLTATGIVPDFHRIPF